MATGSQPVEPTTVYNVHPSMQILLVSTKAPWPPRDGGRLLVLETLKGLSRLGHEIDLVAPVTRHDAQPAQVVEALRPYCEPRLIPSRLPPRLWTFARAQLRGRPYSFTRHLWPEVAKAVQELVRRRPPDIVHVEQPHAMAAAAPAAPLGIPLVLRTQNVESDLWRGLAATVRQPLRRILQRETRRVAAVEGQLFRRADACIALTRRDAARIATQVRDSRTPVFTVAPPFPATLPQGPPLAGEPPLGLLGSQHWLQNRDGASWFLSHVWPRVHERLPRATLHVFGLPCRTTGGVVRHPSPGDSALAFAEGSILVVPLRFASGIRMKILEAWARGIPVIATRTATLGMELEDDTEVLRAETPSDFIDAIGALAQGGELSRSLVEAARRRLAAEHDPAVQARLLLASYEQVLAGAGRRAQDDPVAVPEQHELLETASPAGDSGAA